MQGCLLTSVGSEEGPAAANRDTAGSAPAPGATQEAAHQLQHARVLGDGIRLPAGTPPRLNRGLLHHSPKLGSPTATLGSSVTAAVACCDEVLVRGALLLRTTAPTGAGCTASGCSSTRDTTS